MEAMEAQELEGEASVGAELAEAERAASRGPSGAPSASSASSATASTFVERAEEPEDPGAHDALRRLALMHAAFDETSRRDLLVYERLRDLVELPRAPQQGSHDEEIAELYGEIEDTAQAEAEVDTRIAALRTRVREASRQCQGAVWAWARTQRGVRWSALASAAMLAAAVWVVTLAPNTFNSWNAPS
eukprot:m51a1_g6316 putative C-tail anchored protein (188) ;mRNA; f:337912-338571